MFSTSRLLSGIATGILVVSIGTALAPAASADPGPVVSRTTGVTADALPTAQIDGVAWKQVVVGNTVYVGGRFTTARPAGAAAGVDTVPRGNLMAYDITTGKIVSSFAPSLNGQVKALAVSPDGRRLYVGGDFTTADGQNRYRLAAYDTATGALDTGFVAGVDTTVNAIVATNSTVYIGGAFSNANGNARARLAAFRATDGALLGWAPTADNNSVEALLMSPDGSKLIVGGSFTTLNGSSSGYGLGALSPNDGSLLSWAAGKTVRNGGTQAAILSLTTDGKAIYGTGYVFGPGGNLEGAFSADPTTGNVNWVEDCHGDTYGTYAVNGTVYTVGHAHDCSTLGTFGQTDPWSYHYSLAWTAAATGTLLANKASGYANFAGTPSPGMVNWFPDYAEGSYTGQQQATWNVSGNSRYVVVGGEFPTVNGAAQQGLVRFAVPDVAPDKEGPRVSGYFYKTTQDQVTATSTRVSWPSNWDRDDQSLKYELIRNGDTGNPVYTTTATSQFWNRPTLSFVDKGLTPGTTYQYFVRVTDPDGNATRGDYTTVTTPAAATAPKLTSTSSVPATFSQSGDSYSISAAGSDIWVGVDQYGALYRQDTAAVNASVTAQVKSQSATDPWAKAGVVLRNNVAGAKSSRGYAVMVLTPGNGVSLQWDSNGNGDLDSFATAATGTKAPVWVRLVRSSATTVSGFYSTDGVAWTKVGKTVTVPGAASVQDAGLVMTSHNATTTGTATFGSFTVK